MKTKPTTPLAAVAPATNCSPIFIPVATIRGIEYAQIPTGMSEEDYDFMTLAIKFYGEHHPTFVTKENDQTNDEVCKTCRDTGYVERSAMAMPCPDCIDADAASHR